MERGSESAGAAIAESWAAIVLLGVLWPVVLEVWTAAWAPITPWAWIPVPAVANWAIELFVCIITPCGAISLEVVWWSSICEVVWITPARAGPASWPICWTATASSVIAIGCCGGCCC